MRLDRDGLRKPCNIRYLPHPALFSAMTIASPLRSSPAEPVILCTSLAIMMRFAHGSVIFLVPKQADIPPMGGNVIHNRGRDDPPVLLAIGALTDRMCCQEPFAVSLPASVISPLGCT